MFRGSGTSDGWNIAQNILSSGGNNLVALIGAASVAVNNSGYNPVGDITNPWPPGGGDLTNQVVAGTADPQSATVYTVRHSPKTIVVSGDDVSQIAINGAITGLLTGAFNLGLGETIAITYGKTAPLTAIYAE
jgi:hypothetical protein